MNSKKIPSVEERTVESSRSSRVINNKNNNDNIGELSKANKVYYIF